MVDLVTVQKQLIRVGYRSQLWGRSEVKELCHVLGDDENIVHAVNGHYEGGFALFVATDKRLILVDRKPMYLTLDAISYSTIQEVQLNYRLLNSTINIFTANKILAFNTWSHTKIRSILSYAQEMIMKNRVEEDSYNRRVQYRGNQNMIMQQQPMQQQPMQQQPAYIHEQVPAMPRIYNPQPSMVVATADTLRRDEQPVQPQGFTDSWGAEVPIDLETFAIPAMQNPSVQNVFFTKKAEPREEVPLS